MIELDLTEFNNLLRLGLKSLTREDQKYILVESNGVNKLDLTVQTRTVYLYQSMSCVVKSGMSFLLSQDTALLLEKLTGVVNLSLDDTGYHLHVQREKELDLVLALENLPTDLITKKSCPESWIELDTRKLSSIIYAAGPSNMDRDVIWFTDRAAICSDGFRTAIYKFSEKPELRDISLGINFIGLIPPGAGISKEGNKIWFGDNNKHLRIPRIEFPIPTIIQSLAEMEPANTSYVILRKDDIAKDLEIVRRLSASRDQNYGFTFLELKDGVLTLTPRGNELGSGSIQIQPQESSGELEVALRPSYLAEAFKASPSSSLLLTVVPGPISGINLIAIIDRENDLYHYIAPLNVKR